MAVGLSGCLNARLCNDGVHRQEKALRKETPLGALHKTFPPARDWHAAKAGHSPEGGAVTDLRYQGPHSNPRLDIHVNPSQPPLQLQPTQPPSSSVSSDPLY